MLHLRVGGEDEAAVCLEGGQGRGVVRLLEVEVVWLIPWPIGPFQESSR